MSERDKARQALVDFIESLEEGLDVTTEPELHRLIDALEEAIEQHVRDGWKR
jgi:hypothetical protein